MTIKQLTDKVKAVLNNAGITDASEGEFLVAVALGVKRNATKLNTPITDAEKRKALRWANKRATGTPLTIISHSANFYGRDYFVNTSVLSPRPETEELVELVAKNVNKNARVLDLCTGSGAIAITLELEFGFKNVVASDISARALMVAKKNSCALGAHVRFVQSDLFENLGGRFDCIVSNPPYISETEYDLLEGEVKNFEPKIALVADDDGLAVYKKIATRAGEYLAPNGQLFLEIGETQAEAITEILRPHFKDLEVKCDLEGKPRMIKATKIN